MVYKEIDNKKLNVRKTRKIGGGIYIPMTGYLEDDKKYVVEIEKTKKILNNGERFIDNKIVIQSVDDAKIICQNWNDIECKECEEFEKCELNN